MSKAIEIMGEELPKSPQLFLGYHGHLLTFPIANGTITNGNIPIASSADNSTDIFVSRSFLFTANVG